MNEFASQYGKALYSLCKDDGKCEKILEELTLIEDILEENPEYKNLIDTPALKLEERLKLIEEAFSTLDEILVNFIKILSSKKLFKEFSECKKEYIKNYDRDNNVERVTAITAVPLTDAQLSALKKKIELSLKKTVCIKNEISADIIGGVILRYAGSMTDGSIKGRLKDMEDCLKSVKF